MPVMYVSLKGLMHCTSCMTTIENALYAAGATHFEIDLVTKIGKIVFEDQNTNEIKLVDAIKSVGYDCDVLEMLEDQE
ncbi:MAG TPA: heavy metal-associated domain-containing protein [Acholeplasmataceae bacterium]|nr:heavy metal-associated domain-containing protein [Acholeplasmataceae bacterium]HRX44876.1 heavy metal-associated domain-containing protein [Acholeplasmataceae bacterium]